MTIFSLASRTDWLAANGVNKDWSYNFSLEEAEVVVEVRDAAGVITQFVSNFEFFPTDDSEGFVRYPAVGSALTAGNDVRISRLVPYTQPTAIGQQGRFHPELHERALDRSTKQIQQLRDLAERSVKVPDGEVGPVWNIGPEDEIIAYAADGGAKSSGKTLEQLEAIVATSDSPPANVPSGKLWWESDTGNLFIRYNDGTSDQWVQVNVSGPSAPSIIGNAYDSRIDAQLTSIDPTVDVLYTAGFAAPGDGGAALYKRGVEMAGAFQSADGAWWELAPDNGLVSVLAFGADKSGVADSTAAITSAIAYAAAAGGGRVLFPAGSYKTTANISIPAGVTLEGEQRFKSIVIGAGSGIATHAGLTFNGEHGVIRDLYIRGMDIGVTATSAARACKLCNCKISYNRIGVDWLDGYINSVFGNHITFNSYGMTIRGASYQFNVYDNTIDNNTGGLGILLTGTAGASIHDNTIEGNRIVATGQGAGMVVTGLVSRLSIQHNWFEQNGTQTLPSDGVTPNPYGVDILLGDGTSTLGAEIANTCIPTEFKPLVVGQLSSQGTINVKHNYFFISNTMVHMRLQAPSLLLAIEGNSFVVNSAQARRPVNIVNGGTLTIPEIVKIDRNRVFNAPSGPATLALQGIGNSYVYCDVIPTAYRFVTLDGVDLYTKEMTLAQFAALAGATLNVDARTPSSGNAGLYRDVRAANGVAGIRTVAGSGRVRVGAAAILTIGVAPYVTVLGNPLGQLTYTHSGGTGVMTVGVPGAPDVFAIGALAVPTSAEATFTTGSYYGYAVLSAATYAANFGGQTRLRITDLDVIKIPDVAAAAPVSATQVGVLGDIVWNSAPVAGGPVGWICTTAGTPGTWAPFGSSILEATAAGVNPASLALGAATVPATVTVTGAALGDIVKASFSLSLAGVSLHAYVSAANTVSYFFRNDAGANPADLASGTLKVRVEK